MVSAKWFLSNMKSKIQGKNTSLPHLLTRVGTGIPEGQGKECCENTEWCARL